MNSNAAQAKALRSSCPGCGGAFDTIGYGQMPEHALNPPAELKLLRRCSGSYQSGMHMHEGMVAARERKRALAEALGYHSDLAKAMRSGPEEYIVFHKPDNAGVPCECAASDLPVEERARQRARRAERHDVCVKFLRTLLGNVTKAIVRYEGK